jgi:uncharacterized membrane protein
MLEHLLFELFWFLVFIIAFVHLLKKKDLYTAILFLVPAVVWSLLVEILGVNLWGIYDYSPDFILIIFGVPLAVALGWASIKHFGYYFVTEIIRPKKWFNKDFDVALVSTGFDFLILEPFAFIFKWWIWKQNNFWFGAPLFNFIGWFLIIFIYLTSYHYVTTHFKDRKKRAIYFIILLTIGFVALQLIGWLYLLFFGKWI